MDHVVYIDAREKELEKLLSGTKSMIVRGAAGRKLPYGRVTAGDQLFFVQNDGECLVRARAQVVEVLNSEALSEDQSRQLIEDHQPSLNLTAQQYKRWAGKRYLVLIRLGNISPLEPFRVDRGAYGSMDDWLPVDDIERVTIPTAG